MIRVKEQTVNELVNKIGDDTMENLENIKEINAIGKVMDVKELSENENIIEVEEIGMVNNDSNIKDEISMKNDKIDVSTEKITKKKDVTKFQIAYKAKARSGKGVCTLVYDKKNGKRTMLSKELLDLIGNISEVELAMTDEGIAIAEKLPSNGTKFTLRKVGNKGAIYSSSLVEELIKAFDLDFSDRVSITFTEAEEILIEDTIAIEIKIK